jgi:hypothetical protein
MRHRKHHRSHRLAGLGEPITSTLAALPWLYIAGGALLARLFVRTPLTDKDMERSQVLKSYLDASQNSWFSQAQKAWSTLGIDESAVDEFIARNVDLLDPNLYKSGVAPTVEELKNELRAIVAVAKAQGAGSYGDYAMVARTLQGRM